MQKSNALRVHVRFVLKRTFHLLLDLLGIRRFREHSFFGTLLAESAVIADFGAHRGEFFAALKSEYSISRALLVEANPALAKPLKEAFGNEADVLHAALVENNKEPTITFTRTIEPEASSIFAESLPPSYVLDQIDVPAVELAQALRALDGQVDLAKFDIEGAEVGILQAASASDLARCVQLTVEFHDKRPPQTRRDVDRVCQRLRSEGYGIVNANWPYVDDVVFVNLRSIAVERRLRLRCHMALVNALFVLRGAFFWSVHLLSTFRRNRSF
jgi:FkbM family methyltransferase